MHLSRVSLARARSLFRPLITFKRLLRRLDLGALFFFSLAMFSTVDQGSVRLVIDVTKSGLIITEDVSIIDQNNGGDGEH